MTRARLVLLTLASLTLLAGCEARLVLGATCTYSTECPAPLACTYGRCRAECLTSRDCPVGLRCLSGGGPGVCSVATEESCTGPADCTLPLSCTNRRCRLGCTTTSDCGAAASCDATGFCAEVVSDGAGGRPATGHGALCSAGACEPGLVCQATGGACAAPDTAPTCRAECGGSDESCPSVGVGIVCRCGQCSLLCDPVSDTGCGADVCTLFPYGGSLSFTDCRPPGGTGTRGDPCFDDTECASEHVCFGGRACVELCRSDADCSGGETCRFDYLPPRFDEPTATIGGCGPAPG